MTTSRQAGRPAERPAARVAARELKKRQTRPYGEASHALILKAAEKLFATRGLANVSMQDIAEAANVSRATVFNQFGSKQLVLDAITARSLEAYRNLLHAALENKTTPTPDLLRLLFKGMGEGIELNRSLYREVFVEIRKVSMGLDQGGASPALRAETFAMLVTIFELGQDRGDISLEHPAEALATAYDSLLSGAVIQWLHGHRKTSLPALLSSLVDVFLNGAAPKA
jgi:AcrR family transcriptional regulator